MFCENSKIISLNFNNTHNILIDLLKLIKKYYIRD